MLNGSDVTSGMTPTKVGVNAQGDIEEMGGFADRFFWARHQARIGAPTIAEKTGCGQALVSNIERGGAKSSKFNDKFAKLFGVDPEWLRSGGGRPPAGYRAEDAQAMRKRGPGRGADVIRLSDMTGGEPRWLGAPEEASEEERAQLLQKRIFADFQDYAQLVGREQAAGLIEVLTRLSALVTPIKVAKRDSD